MKPITLVLADDHRIVREGFRGLSQYEQDMEVVGEASTGREAVQLAKQLQPVVVVMDIAMPQLNGLEAARQILESVPTTKVIILSAHGDDSYVEQVAKLGVAGYLVKQTSAVVLAKAIRAVTQGTRYFSRSISRRLAELQKMSPQGMKGRVKAKGVKLTSREVETLQLIAEGMANKQSAAALGISIKTVEKHRQNLMNKLDIHDTAGLTRYAIASGVIEGGVRMTIE